MTRACQCGGIIRQHQLTGEREARTCGTCGRYGAIRRADEPESSAQGQLLDEKDCSCVRDYGTMAESTCGDTETSAAPSRMCSPPLAGQGVAAPGAQP